MVTIYYFHIKKNLYNLE